MKFKNQFPFPKVYHLLLSHLRKGVSKKEAVGLSIFIHIIVSAAFGVIFFKSSFLSEPIKETNVEFELVPIEDMISEQNDFQTNDSDLPKDADKAQVVSKSLGDPTSSSAMLVAEEAKVNKDAVMMASLSSLLELRESFNFVVQQISTDSVGAFTPIHGAVPNTSVLSAGALNGSGFGNRRGIIAISGGGNGSCPPNR
ncbi:MAG: hypothetical protein ACE5IR_19200 [bacterium]